MVIESYQRRRLSGRMELAPIHLTLNIFPREKYLGRPLCFEKIGSLAEVEILFDLVRSDEVRRLRRYLGIHIVQYIYVHMRSYGWLYN